MTDPPPCAERDMDREPADDFPDSERPSSSSFDDEDFLFHLYRGSELLQDNCVSEAKEELEKALSLQPRDVEGQGLLGVVYFRLGLYPRAIQIYEHIIRACPQENTPRVNLALCYLKTGQQLLARDMLEEVVRRVPGHTRAWGYLGLVFERLGEFTKALAAFERASQPHMVRRMQQQLEVDDTMLHAPHDSVRPERDQLRAAAADAAGELEADDHPGPFVAIAGSEPADAPSRAGRWSTTEPGEEPIPAPAQRRSPSLVGRFGPAVPALAVSEAPPSIATHSPALGGPPTPAALAQQVMIAASDARFAPQPGGALLVSVDPAITARVDAVRALSPVNQPFKSSNVRRRSRGRDLEEPLGGLGSPLISLEGRGNLLMFARDGRRTIAVEVGRDLLYVREDHLLAFEPDIRHENGRLATGAADHIAMVQLSGKGTVVLEARRELRAVEVSPERSVTVRVDDVVGWTGRLLAHPLGPEEAPGALQGFVAFSGEGAVLLDIG